MSVHAFWYPEFGLARLSSAEPLLTDRRVSARDGALLHVWHARHATVLVRVAGPGGLHVGEDTVSLVASTAARLEVEGDVASVRSEGMQCLVRWTSWKVAGGSITGWQEALGETTRVVRHPSFADGPVQLEVARMLDGGFTPATWGWVPDGKLPEAGAHRLLDGTSGGHRDALARLCARAPGLVAAMERDGLAGALRTVEAFQLVERLPPAVLRDALDAWSVAGAALVRMELVTAETFLDRFVRRPELFQGLTRDPRALALAEHRPDLAARAILGDAAGLVEAAAPPGLADAVRDASSDELRFWTETLKLRADHPLLWEVRLGAKIRCGAAEAARVQPMVERLMAAPLERLLPRFQPSPPASLGLDIACDGRTRLRQHGGQISELEAVLASVDATWRRTAALIRELVAARGDQRLAPLVEVALALEADRCDDALSRWEALEDTLPEGAADALGLHNLRVDARLAALREQLRTEAVREGEAASRWLWSLSQAVDGVPDWAGHAAGGAANLDACLQTQRHILPPAQWDAVFGELGLASLWAPQWRDLVDGVARVRARADRLVALLPGEPVALDLAAAAGEVEREPARRLASILHATGLLAAADMRRRIEATIERLPPEERDHVAKSPHDPAPGREILAVLDQQAQVREALNRLAVRDAALQQAVSRLPESIRGRLAPRSGAFGGGEIPKEAEVLVQETQVKLQDLQTRAQNLEVFVHGAWGPELWEDFPTPPVDPVHPAAWIDWLATRLDAVDRASSVVNEAERRCAEAAIERARTIGRRFGAEARSRFLEVNEVLVAEKAWQALHHAVSDERFITVVAWRERVFPTRGSPTCLSSLLWLAAHREPVATVARAEEATRDGGRLAREPQALAEAIDAIAQVGPALRAAGTSDTAQLRRDLCADLLLRLARIRFCLRDVLPHDLCPPCDDVADAIAWLDAARAETGPRPRPAPGEARDVERRAALVAEALRAESLVRPEEAAACR